MEVITHSGKILSNNGAVAIPRYANSISRKGLELWMAPFRSDSYPGKNNTVYDLSGKGRNGTFNNYSYPDRKLDYYWDGKSFAANSTQYYASLSAVITLPNSNVNPYFAHGYFNDFTLSIWLKIDTTMNYQTPVIIYSGSKAYYIDINDPDGTLYRGIWNYWNSAGNIRSAVPANFLGGLNPPFSDFCTNQWIEYTFVREYGVGAKHYFNGQLYVGPQYDGDPGWQSEPIPAGNLAYGGFASTFGGRSGSLAIWSRCLTNTEILRNYQSLKNNYQ